jgi:hypothetical protein
MKFLCLVHFEPDAFADVTPAQMQAIDDATIEHDHKLRQGGHLLIASPLADITDQVTIDRRRQRMKAALTDGPYAESKEVVGGFLLIEANSMEDAVALFDDDPIAAYGRLDIRPLMETHRHSETGAGRPEFVAI